MPVISSFRQEQRCAAHFQNQSSAHVIEIYFSVSALRAKSTPSFNTGRLLPSHSKMTGRDRRTILISTDSYNQFLLVSQLLSVSSFKTAENRPCREDAGIKFVTYKNLNFKLLFRSYSFIFGYKHQVVYRLSRADADTILKFKEQGPLARLVPTMTISVFCFHKLLPSSYLANSSIRSADGRL